MTINYQYPYNYSPFPFPQPSNNGMMPLEQSYIENILRLNMCRSCQIHKCQHSCFSLTCHNISSSLICVS